MWTRPLAHPAKNMHRTQRGWRGGQVEALEGRALLATNALDPLFGTNGAVLGTTISSSTINTNPSAVAAITTLSNGQIITAETQVADGTATGSTTPLVVRRYNSDGTLDTTFGTNGSTTIPFPTSGAARAQLPRNLEIQSDGKIVLADEAIPADSDIGVGVVVRLTSSGHLDPTFGTNGEFVLASTVTNANSVLIEPSGRIVVAGVLDLADSSGALASRTAALVGLTTTGGIDSTFGSGGLVTVPLAASVATPIASGKTLAVAGLQLTPTGQILLGITETDQNNTYVAPTDALSSTLTRLSGAGAIDTTFGSGGTLSLTSTILANDLAVLPDGRILLAGEVRQANPISFEYDYYGALVQLRDDGTIDPTFTTVRTPTSNETFQRLVVGTDGTITTLSAAVGRAYRYLPSGLPDASVGVGGRLTIRLPAIADLDPSVYVTRSNVALALAANGEIIVGGDRQAISFTSSTNPTFTYYSQSDLAEVRVIPLRDPANDYDGDGRSDPAALLPSYSDSVYRPSGGSYGDYVMSIGGQAYPDAIPAPGDYNGDGRADQVAYDQASGSFLLTGVTSPYSQQVVPFGAAGVGESIPVPGDYDGDGKTDLAVYMPQVAVLAYRPSSNPSGGDVYESFGVTGAGNAIPAPGDYDGDGKTDLAVYLPQIGVLAYRPSSGDGTQDVYEAFGVTGAGNAIPVPGDYDGDGKTDVAVYLPQTAVYAYRSSAGKGDNLQTFGVVGQGQVVPVPGDYDGDGTDDIAVYVSQIATWIYRSTRGQGDVAQSFGAPGAGQTIPATVVVIPTTGGMSTMSLAASAYDAEPAVQVYLPDDLPGTATHKRPTT